jgi:hypothetical protein
MMTGACRTAVVLVLLLTLVLTWVLTLALIQEGCVDQVRGVSEVGCGILTGPTQPLRPMRGRGWVERVA